MTTPAWMSTMERDELVRLAGEQALLDKEVKELSAQFNRDRQALQGLCNEVSMQTFHGKPQWLEGGIALLTRLHETQTKLNQLNGQLDALRKMTGL